MSSFKKSLESSKKEVRNKVKKDKEKEKEAKKQVQQRKAQWVQIDNDGNKVKAFIETDADKTERKRRERKDLKKEIKRKFLEEQEKKKQRKKELEKKLLEPLEDKANHKEEKHKRKRHDTDSDSDGEVKEEQEVPVPRENAHIGDSMKSGLQSIDDIKKSIENSKKINQISESEAFDQLKGQKTVFRDKDGKIISENEMASMMVSK